MIYLSSKYGHPIRFLLAYAGVDYVEKTYVMGGPPEYSWESWLEDKFNLGLDFPNVRDSQHAEIRVCPFSLQNNS